MLAQWRFSPVVRCDVVFRYLSQLHGVGRFWLFGKILSFCFYFQSASFISVAKCVGLFLHDGNCLMYCILRVVCLYTVFDNDGRMFISYWLCYVYKCAPCFVQLQYFPSNLVDYFDSVDCICVHVQLSRPQFLTVTVHQVSPLLYPLPLLHLLLPSFVFFRHLSLTHPHMYSSFKPLKFINTHESLTHIGRHNPIHEVLASHRLKLPHHHQILASVLGAEPSRRRILAGLSLHKRNIKWPSLRFLSFIFSVI